MGKFGAAAIALYRSWWLRIPVILATLIIASYFLLVLPWVNNNISRQYQQLTGHQLQHDKLDVHLFSCNFALNNLKDSANLWQIKSVKLDVACWKSFQQRALIINHLQIDQLSGNPLQRKTGAWNFNDVLEHIAKSTPKPQPNSDKHNPVAIKKLSITRSSITTNLLALNDLALSASPFELTVLDLDLRRDAPASFLASATLNKTTDSKISGKINPLTLSGDVNFSVTRVPFAWFDSSIKPYLALDVLHGELNTDGQLQLVNGNLQQLTSNGQLTELKVRPTTMDQDAVHWKSFNWKAADINFAKRSINIPRAVLTELDGQFIITKDRTTNVQAIIIPTPKTTPAEQGASSATTEASWQFGIDELSVEKAAIGFYDQSLKPSFTVIVQQFSGLITNINTNTEKMAEFHLAGNVDGYAPVSLDGKAQFFIPQPQMEALVSFKKMDMGALSPYSAEYAGWRIKKGLLSVDLDYHYDHGKILGKNHVVIDHLEFGDKVRSPHVIDVPLRLGLSLLTDEHGIAILDAEITGDPNDPQFDLKSTIQRALRNTLKKVLTSPFRWLASLVDSKEDLGFIAFTPGESQLTQAAKEKLALLQDAMKKRPKMHLTIRGNYDAEHDRIALQEEQVKSALEKNGLSQDAIKTQNADWVKALDMQYKAKGLTNVAADNAQKFNELATLEVVDPERLLRLVRERGQAVKQYFVLQLGADGSGLFLESDPECTEKHPCNASDVQFTLED